MIDTLLNSELVADGEIVKIERDLDGLRLKCRDGSGCRLNHVHDSMGALWIMDIWTAREEVITVSATTKEAANRVWVEEAEEGVERAMIYDVLSMVSCLLRYGWWVYSLLVWDEDEQAVKVVHRDNVEGRTVVCDIVSVAGWRWDDAVKEGC